MGLGADEGGGGGRALDAARHRRALHPARSVDLQPPPVAGSQHLHRIRSKSGMRLGTGN